MSIRGAGGFTQFKLSLVLGNLGLLAGVKWMSHGAYNRLSYAQEQRRRHRAALLFVAGRSAIEVAQELGVTRQSGYRWYRRWKAGGYAGLVGPGRSGSFPKLARAKQDVLAELLLKGPQAQGFASTRWTLARVAHVIQRQFGVSYHQSQVRKLLNSLGWYYQPCEPEAFSYARFIWRR